MSIKSAFFVNQHFVVLDSEFMACINNSALPIDDIFMSLKPGSV